MDEEPINNYHPMLQFASALQSNLTSFSSLLWLFKAHNFTALIHSHGVISRHSRQTFTAKKGQKLTVHYAQLAVQLARNPTRCCILTSNWPQLVLEALFGPTGKVS